MLEVGFYPRPPDDATLSVTPLVMNRVTHYVYTLRWMEQGQPRAWSKLSEIQGFLEQAWRGNTPGETIIERVYCNGMRLTKEAYTITSYDAYVLPYLRTEA